ncbi:MAG: glycine cleavage system aminomethyltransferase GcvT [Thermoleophilia bacterium]
MTTLKRTPLYDRHVALGAKLAPFAGWEMPIQYAGIAEEHRAVRTRAGVFDVSHMGQFAVKGPYAHSYLQERLSNDLDRIGPGEAQYTLLCTLKGGIVDDLIAYRTDNGYLLVVNAGNREQDHEHLPYMDDVSDEWAMLAVQGPEALALLGHEVEPWTFRRQQILGVDCLICGTGYTGERGCELLCNAADVGLLWDAILERGIVPCGLGARDTLRLEACYPLHGQDITEETNPFEAGLGWAVRLGKGRFVGSNWLEYYKRTAPSRKLVPFVMEDRAIPRAGMRVGSDGIVTSGGFSPMLEQGIGLAYVWAGMAEVGRTLSIDVRGRERRARIVRRPIYPPPVQQQEEQS